MEVSSMNARTEHRLNKIEVKIKSNGFSKSELLYFRVFHKKTKKTFSEKSSEELNLKSIVAVLSNNSFSVASAYIYTLIFFSLGYLFTDDYSSAVYFYSATFIVGVVHIIYNSKKNKLHIITELKLIKLYLRSYF